MLKKIVMRVMAGRKPDRMGPGFFTWSVFGRNWVALVLRYGDDLRQLDQSLLPVPVTFRVFVVDGEILLHSCPDLVGGRAIHTYARHDTGDEVTVYAVKAGQSIKVPAGAPALVELNPTRDPYTVFLPWMAEQKSERRLPAKMIVVRMPY